jgi:hypothetical protein
MIPIIKWDISAKNGQVTGGLSSVEKKVKV